MSQSSDTRNARKFWWILMILPIGLVIGTVTSVINHLRQNDEEEAQLAFQVAVALNAKDIDAALERSTLLGGRNLTTELGIANTQTVNRFLQGSVSPGGTGIQFTEATIAKSNHKSLQLAYADILGSKENEYIAIVIELVAKQGRSDAAKLALTPSLIRSLSEVEPTHSLRFVFTPETQSASQHAQSLRQNTLSSAKQKIHKVIVLKEQDEVDIADPNDWKILGSSPAELASTYDSNYLDITHPILLRNTAEEISPQFRSATLNAADQLRQLILKLAN